MADYAISREKLGDRQGPVIHDLRKKYPELEFLFEEIDGYRDGWANNQWVSREDAGALQDEIAELNMIIGRLEDKIERLER